MSEYDGELKSTQFVKKIKVNDKGDFITINIQDVEFIERCEKLKELINRFVESKDPNLSQIKQAAELVDDIFGPDTCVKVFGVKYPVLPAIVDLFYKLMPFIEESQKEYSSYFDGLKNKYTEKASKRGRG